MVYNNAILALTIYIKYGNPDYRDIDSFQKQDRFTKLILEDIRKDELDNARSYYERQMVEAKNKDVPKIKEYYEQVKAQIIAHFEAVQAIFDACDDEDQIVFLNDPNVVIDGCDMPCIYRFKAEEAEDDIIVSYPSFKHKIGREYQLTACTAALPCKRWVFTSTMSDDVQYSEPFAEYKSREDEHMTVFEAAVYNYSFEGEHLYCTMSKADLNVFFALEKHLGTKYFKCKDCRAMFLLTGSNIAWFEEKGFALPTRCPACRKKRKAERE